MSIASNPTRYFDQMLIGLPALPFMKGLEICNRGIEKNGKVVQSLAKIGAFACKVMIVLTSIHSIVYAIAKVVLLLVASLFAGIDNKKKNENYIRSSIVVGLSFAFVVAGELRPEEYIKVTFKSLTCSNGKTKQTPTEIQEFNKHSYLNKYRAHRAKSKEQRANRGAKTYLKSKR